MSTIKELMPKFAEELKRLILAQKTDLTLWTLAGSIDDLEVVGKCGCGQDNCATFYTLPESERMWDDNDVTAGSIEIDEKNGKGLIVMDIRWGKISGFEVLWREDVKECLENVP